MPEIRSFDIPTDNKVQHEQPAPLVSVKGSHRQIGQAMGEACRAQVHQHVANTHELLIASYASLQLSWDGAVIQARKYLPFAQERYPQYVDELLGIAEGADVAFDDVMVINAIEAVTMDALHLTKCTSFAVNQDLTTDGHVLVGHNEDWLPEDEPLVYLVNAEPNDEPPFLAMTYGALLPNIGFNAYGIAQCCDSVYPKDSRIGLPRVILSRAILAARTPSEAIRRAIIPHRAAGYNHLLVHDSGEMYNVEVSARRFAILYGDEGFLAHTNHYLDYDMQSVENEPDELIDTRVRYFRAYRFLYRTEIHSLRTLQNIQRDHLNFPNSICNHSEIESHALQREKTINALIMDLTSRVMHLAWGTPCCNSYHPYYLSA